MIWNSIYWRWNCILVQLRRRFVTPCKAESVLSIILGLYRNVHRELLPPPVLGGCPLLSGMSHVSWYVCIHVLWSVLVFHVVIRAFLLKCRTMLAPLFQQPSVAFGINSTPSYHLQGLLCSGSLLSLWVFTHLLHAFLFFHHTCCVNVCPSHQACPCLRAFALAVSCLDCSSYHQVFT